MKSQYLNLRSILLMAIAVAMLTSCGYYNPYVYHGPTKAVYISSWKNRTNELQLESQIYQSLLMWFQKNKALAVVQDKEDADLILGGEVLFIDLPSLSYSAGNVTREVKLRLKVRYVVKDLKTEKILLQEPGQQRTEEYLVSDNSSETADNEAEALATIVDELSQDIYLRILAELRKK